MSSVNEEKSTSSHKQYLPGFCGVAGILSASIFWPFSIYLVIDPLSPTKVISIWFPQPVKANVDNKIDKDNTFKHLFFI